MTDTICKITDSELTTYGELFVNRTDIYFKQWASPDAYGYTCIKPDDAGFRAVDNAMIAEHLAGKVTLGWAAVNTNGHSKWCCWDFDLESTQICEFQEYLSELGIKAYREGGREGRAGHLWVFFDKPVASSDLIIVNDEFRRHLGEEFRKTEFFPKSIIGLSQVRGPLGIHRKPDACNSRGWFEDAPKDMKSQLMFLNEIELTPCERFENVAQALRLRAPKPKRLRSQAKPEANRPGDDFSAKQSWEDILVPHGWSFVRKHGNEEFWRRPGKIDRGCSASINFKGSNVLKIFSSNAFPFEQNHTYTKFGAYALLNYDGDFKLCARELKRLGYGGLAENDEVA